MAYDLASGAVVWQAGGTTVNAIPTPVFGDGLLIAMGGFRGSMARAIRVSEARGDVTGTPAQVWTYEKDTPYVPSPLLYRGSLYFLKVNTGSDQLDTNRRSLQRAQVERQTYTSRGRRRRRVYVVGREGKTACSRRVRR